jgi:putative phage-type endonuclease
MSETDEKEIIEGPMPKTPEWYSERQSHIGGSEAAAACGISRWQQPLDLYMRKRGMIPEQIETDAMRMGTALEPVVREEWTLRTGRQCSWNYPMMWRAECPIVSATIDCLTIPEGDPLELKTSSWRRADEWGEEGTDQVPDDYILQCQQEMYVVGAERCELAVLLDGRTLKLYAIARHEKLIDGIIRTETELWQRIQAGDPPEPKWNHPRTMDLIKELYGVNEGAATDLPPEIVAAWGNVREFNKRIKELEEQRDADKARVLAAMGEAAIADLGDGLQLVRSKVNRKEYTAKATSYISLRERKAK